MKYKIFIVIFFSFFLIIPTTFAKTIQIDSKNYYIEDGNVLTLDDLTYNTNTNTLTLTNSKHQHILTNEDLKIILIGENTLINPTEIEILLNANKLEIYGPGSLKIEGGKTGIRASSILVTNATLDINTTINNIATTNSYGTIIINNSNLIGKSTDCIFSTLEQNIFLSNSNLNLNTTNTLLGGFSKNLFINNTTLFLKSDSGISYFVEQPIYINGDSHIYLETTKNELTKNDYILDKNITILGSDDGINYHIPIDIEKNNYIKIDYQNNNNLDEKEEQLNLKEEQLNLKEKQLNEISLNLTNQQSKLNELELKLHEEEKDLTIKSDELLFKEENLLKFENDLKTNIQMLLTKKIKLTKIQKKLYKLKTNLKCMENDLIKKQSELKKQKEEINLNQKKNLELIDLENNKLITKENNLNVLKTNLEVQEKILKEKEMKVDDIIESNKNYARIYSNNIEENNKNKMINKDNKISKIVLLSSLPLLCLINVSWFIYFKKKVTKC